jgi:MFS family permease
MSAVEGPGSARRDGFVTDIPARLDRLPWARWHWLVIIALGAVWILDGLEVTIVGGIGPQLQDSLHFSSTQVGLAGSIYVAGAVTGALGFGYLTDRLGRRRLFMVTIGLYLVATALTGFTWDFWSFAFCRFLTGAGIGGEYSAINSAIDELIPARVRGWVDLAINGSFWAGAAGGAALTWPLLHGFSSNLGWRLVFASGAILGVFVLVTRRFLPESPRWLMTHGRADEAERIVAEIERQVQQDVGEPLPPPDGEPIRINPRDRLGFGEIARVMFRNYRRRSLLGFVLMGSQAFFYNAIFFTYALVLTDFMGVGKNNAVLYLIPFALGNFLGPLLLGRLFDTVGRRRMIGGCYLASGVLMTGAAYLFDRGSLSATTLTIAWSVIFFFASAGASAAYLTVSEIFPLELRAMAIAFFYAVSTAIGGITGPVLFGALIGTGDRGNLFIGYLAGAALMLIAGLVEFTMGVDAEAKSLEDIAQPLSAEDGDTTPAPTDERSLRPAGARPVGEWTVDGGSASRARDRALEREMGLIVALLGDAGPLPRRAIGARLLAGRWGPGQLGNALSRATSEGRIQRVGPRVYAVVAVPIRRTPPDQQRGVPV